MHGGGDGSRLSLMTDRRQPSIGKRWQHNYNPFRRSVVFLFSNKKRQLSIIVQQCRLGWLLCNTDIILYFTNKRECFILLLYCIRHIYIYPFQSAFCTEMSFIGQKKVCTTYMYILYFTNFLLIPRALLTGFVLYIVLR